MSKVGDTKTGIKFSQIRENYNMPNSAISMNSFSYSKIGTGAFDPQIPFRATRDAIIDSDSYIYANIEESGDWDHRIFNDGQSTSSGGYSSSTTRSSFLPDVGRHAVVSRKFGHIHESDYLFEQYGIDIRIVIDRPNSSRRPTFKFYLKSTTGRQIKLFAHNDDVQPLTEAPNFFNYIGIAFPFQTSDTTSGTYVNNDKLLYTIYNRGLLDNGNRTFTWGGFCSSDFGSALQAGQPAAGITIPADGSWKLIASIENPGLTLKHDTDNNLTSSTYYREEYPLHPEDGDSTDLLGIKLSGIDRIEYTLPASPSSARKAGMERFTGTGKKQGEVRRTFNWDPGHSGDNAKIINISYSDLDYSGDSGHTTAVFVLKADFEDTSDATSFVNDFISTYGYPTIVTNGQNAATHGFELTNTAHAYSSTRNDSVGTGVVLIYWGHLPDSAINNANTNNTFSFGDAYEVVSGLAFNQFNQTAQVMGGSLTAGQITSSGHVPKLQAALYHIVGVSQDDNDIIHKYYVDNEVGDDNGTAVPLRSLSDAHVVSLTDGDRKGGYCTIGAVASDMPSDVFTLTNQNAGFAGASLTFTSDYNEPTIFGSTTIYGSQSVNLSPGLYPLAINESGGNEYLASLPSSYYDDVGPSIGYRPNEIFNNPTNSAQESFGLINKGMTSGQFPWPFEGPYLAAHAGPDDSYWRGKTFDHVLSNKSIGCDAFSVLHPDYPSRYRPRSRYANVLNTISFKWDTSLYRPPNHVQSRLSVDNRQRPDDLPWRMIFAEQIHIKDLQNAAGIHQTGATTNSSGSGVYNSSDGVRARAAADDQIPVAFETRLYAENGIENRRLPYFAGGGSSKNTDLNNYRDPSFFYSHPDQGTDSQRNTTWHNTWETTKGQSSFSSDSAYFPRLDYLKSDGSGTYDRKIYTEMGTAQDDIHGNQREYQVGNQATDDYIDLGFAYRIVCVGHDPLDDNCPIYELYVTNGGSLMNFELPDGSAYCKTIINELPDFDGVLSDTGEESIYPLKGKEIPLDANGQRIERCVARFKPIRNPGYGGGSADNQDFSNFSVHVQDHTEYPRNDLMYDYVGLDTSRFSTNTDVNYQRQKTSTITFDDIATFHGDTLNCDVTLRFEDYPDTDPTYPAFYESYKDARQKYATFENVAADQRGLDDQIVGLATVYENTSLNNENIGAQIVFGNNPEYGNTAGVGLKFYSLDGKAKRIEFGPASWGEDGLNTTALNNIVWRTDLKDGTYSAVTGALFKHQLANQDTTGYQVIEIPATGFSDIYWDNVNASNLYNATFNGNATTALSTPNDNSGLAITFNNVDRITTILEGKEALSTTPNHPDEIISGSPATKYDVLGQSFMHGFKSLGLDYDGSPANFSASARNASSNNGIEWYSSTGQGTDTNVWGYANNQVKDAFDTIRIGNKVGSSMGGKIVTRFAYNATPTTNIPFSDIKPWGYDHQYRATVGDRRADGTFDSATGVALERDNHSRSRFERTHTLLIHGTSPINDGSAVNETRNHLLCQIFFRTVMDAFIWQPAIIQVDFSRKTDDHLHTGDQINKLYHWSMTNRNGTSNTANVKQSDRFSTMSGYSDEASSKIEVFEGDVIQFVHQDHNDQDAPSDTEAFDNSGAALDVLSHGNSGTGLFATEIDGRMLGDTLDRGLMTSTDAQVFNAYPNTLDPAVWTSLTQDEVDAARDYITDTVIPYLIDNEHFEYFNHDRYFVTNESPQDNWLGGVNTIEHDTLGVYSKQADQSDSHKLAINQHGCSGYHNLNDGTTPRFEIYFDTTGNIGTYYFQHEKEGATKYFEIVVHPRFKEN